MPNFSLFSHRGTTRQAFFFRNLFYSVVYLGYIETGYETSVEVTWIVLHSLITYERTRETQRMSPQRAYKTLIKYASFPMRSNCVLKSETWKMSLSLDRIIKWVEVTSRSCFIYITAKGAKNTRFFPRISP